MHIPARPLSTGQRLVTALADLCRRDPALWSAVVRRADQLERESVERSAASWQALEENGH